MRMVVAALRAVDFCSNQQLFVAILATKGTRFGTAYIKKD
jgi:hypothetical protein